MAILQNGSTPLGGRGGGKARGSFFPLPLLLDAQNLSFTLNYAKQLNLVPGFNNNLRYNFNHLIYADALLIVTIASRKSTRNVKFCLNIYSYLASQKPNLGKSKILFPNWFSKIVSTNICSILRFSPSKTPFT